MNTSKLNLGWWNIGISPPIRSNKAKKTDAITLAGNYITQFIQQRDLDFFALCEVSEDESCFLNGLAENEKFTFVDLTSSVGRIIIDISVIYNPEKLSYVEHTHLTEVQPDGKSLRAGVKVIFKELKNNDEIVFYLSHWPSKLRNNESVRESIATYIRNDINNILNKNIDAKIICMGDYNAQPYSYALRKKLFATRDFHLIEKRKKLLFNPFWKILSDGLYNNIGTYYYSAPSANRWYVFDQMIFSSSFVTQNKDNLKLILNSTDCHKVINDIDNAVSDVVYLDNFDHLPIFCGLHYE